MKTTLLSWYWICVTFFNDVTHWLGARLESAQCWQYNTRSLFICYCVCVCVHPHIVWCYMSVVASRTAGNSTVVQQLMVMARHCLQSRDISIYLYIYIHIYVYICHNEPGTGHESVRMMYNRCRYEGGHHMGMIKHRTDVNGIDLVFIPT